MDVINTFIATWSPALVAIGGVVITVISVITDVKKTIGKIDSSMIKDDNLKMLIRRLDQLATDNEELQRLNKLLIDQIAKIEGYSDSKKGPPND